MKIPRKTAVKALAAVPLLVLALTSCSSEPQDPAAIMSEYIEHLNSGDFEAALELVHKPGDVTAGSIVKLEGFDIPQPTTQVEAFEDDAESQAVQFDIEGTEDDGGDYDEWRNATFIKSDGEWLLEAPMFLSDAVGDILGGSSIITEDGIQIEPGAHMVTHMPQEIYLSVDFPGNDFVESKEFDALAETSPTKPLYIYSTTYDDVEQIQFEVTDNLLESMEQRFRDLGEQRLGTSFDVTMVDFPAKEDCQVAKHSGLSAISSNPTFEVSCADEQQANIKVSHVTPGLDREQRNGSAIFKTTIEDGEIYSVEYEDIILH